MIGDYYTKGDSNKSVLTKVKSELRFKIPEIEFELVRIYLLLIRCMMRSSVEK